MSADPAKPPSRPGPVSVWVAGARPRTLPAAAIAVVVGTAAVGVDNWWRALGALVVAVALQIGANYANDYADGVRGTDGSARVGPVRLVGSGIRSAADVRRASIITFAIAGLVGLWLAVSVDLRLLGLGAAALWAAWFYTGGARPYGYRGLGELSVFIFFGLVATLGAAYLQAKSVNSAAVGGAICVGCLATALLVVNNLRDIPGDRLAGKRTLAVRLGDPVTRKFFVGLVGCAFLSMFVLGIWEPAFFLVGLALPMALSPLRRVWRGDEGQALVPVLGEIGRLQVVVGVFFVVASLLS
ncbi:MAG: 1,4-dihydroxy-2-naphthoate polyprenyltransferase [Actinomycetia bacterium]|nr:1,4-dihydroxy-2-naphthoate polyprenyltransferase [Actinomycetes bacterium]